MSAYNMKCPHCGLALNYDKNSPEALLQHIRSQIKGWQRQIDKGDQGSAPEWLPRTIEKWQAWSDWVSLQIENDVEN